MDELGSIIHGCDIVPTWSGTAILDPEVTQEFR